MLRVIASFLALFAFALPGFAFNAELTRPLAYYPASPTPTPVPNAQPIPPRPKPVIRAEPLKINEYPFDNRAKYRAGFVGTRASLNLGTRTVGVPVALRVAGGAARFAVSAFNPWIAGAQLAVMAIPFVLDWFGLFNAQSDTTLGVDASGKVTISASQLVPGFAEVRGANVNLDLTRDAQGRSIRDIIVNRTTPISTEHYCPYNDGTYIEVFHLTWPTYPAGARCGMGAVEYLLIDTCEPYPRMKTTYQMCPGVDGVVFGASQVETLTPDELELLSQMALDIGALAELGIPIMVEDLPIINPAALPEGQVKVGETNPAPELFPRPIRYPNGDPVLIPGTDPPLYTQPWYEVTGSPTLDNPWRVTIAHVTTTTSDPTPVGDPTDPVEPPPPPFDFYTDCDKFPGSLGCSAIGDPPDVEEVPSETRTFSLQAGPTFSGSGCPSNLNVSFAGHSFQVVDMSVPCGWLSGLVKPIFVLLSLISAVFIVRSAL